MLDPSATMERVRGKINNLRSAFCRLEKVKQFKKCGSSTDGIYVPILWYYELYLLFTKKTRNAISNDDRDTEGSEVETKKSQNAISNDDRDTEGSEVETDEVSTYIAWYKFIICKHVLLQVWVCAAYINKTLKQMTKYVLNIWCFTGYTLFNYILQIFLELSASVSIVTYYSLDYWGSISGYSK
jgi:hypothetical protein